VTDPPVSSGRYKLVAVASNANEEERIESLPATLVNSRDAQCN
jgi:hypothetical protein